jgi:hypothetical protein
MAEHLSLRERLTALWGHGEPTFEPSDDSTIAAFADLFAGTDLLAFDANKHLRTDALSPIYDCQTERRASADAAVEQFAVHWSPVWSTSSPVTGFRTGQDSALLGSTPTIAMPQDERTAALLLLVTTPYVHLSANREGPRLLVQGAYIDDDNDYRYVTLSPAALKRVEDASAHTAETAG